MTITAHHLAPPEKVASGATVYVVWVRSPIAGGRPMKIGAIKPDDKLDASLETLTTLPDFDVLITAEASANVVSPSVNTVFTGHGAAH